MSDRIDKQDQVQIVSGRLISLFKSFSRLGVRQNLSTISIPRRVGSQAELYDGLLKIYQREEMMYAKVLFLGSKNSLH